MRAKTVLLGANLKVPISALRRQGTAQARFLFDPARTGDRPAIYRRLSRPAKPAGRRATGGRRHSAAQAAKGWRFADKIRVSKAVSQILAAASDGILELSRAATGLQLRQLPEGKDPAQDTTPVIAAGDVMSKMSCVVDPSHSTRVSVEPSAPADARCSPPPRLSTRGARV